MGRKKKPYRVYLFTRPPKPKEDGKENGSIIPPAVKLRVQAIANGKSRFATFPLLVSDFSKHFNSDGTLKDGCCAVSLKEKFESACISAAFQASCRAVEYMLQIDPDYWQYAPASYFDELVNNEYEAICDGRKKSESYIACRIREDKEREAENRVPFWRENLDDWRYAAGVGPQPPQWVGSHMDYEVWKNHMKASKR